VTTILEEKEQSLNIIGAEGAKSLSDALQKNHSLTQIDLRKKSIGNVFDIERNCYLLLLIYPI